MEKNIDQYLPLYLGQNAKVIQYDLFEYKNELSLGDTLPISLESLSQIQKGNLKLIPILRPISSMTEEEKLELYKIINPRSLENEDYMRSITIDELIENKLQLFKLTEIAEGIQYLLSKGFDIFGLKEKGLCLYPEDL